MKAALYFTKNERFYANRVKWSKHWMKMNRINLNGDLSDGANTETGWIKFADPDRRSTTARRAIKKLIAIGGLVPINETDPILYAPDMKTIAHFFRKDFEAALNDDLGADPKAQPEALLRPLD